VENHFYCGECFQCKHGKLFFIVLCVIIFALSDERHICQRLNQFGHGKGTIYGGTCIIEAESLSLVGRPVI